MSVNPRPVHLGQFPAVKAGDIVDRYIDITEDLESGETVSSVAFTVVNAATGATAAGVVTGHTETDNRTDFRLALPSTAGMYTLTAVFTISDGQKITKTATLWVV